MMKLVKDNISGVNEVQCYIKSPESRTPAHQENQLVASANGYCVNAAWNVAEMCLVQLAAVAYSHDNNVELQYGTLLPIYDVLLEIAQLGGHPELKKLAKRLLIRYVCFSFEFLWCKLAFFRPLARANWEWNYCEDVQGKTSVYYRKTREDLEKIFDNCK
ncbi:hypothetical protein CRE_11441 [Caenorhabditis remanei]|uniref:Uncharacterized protein n=1 Tax=Caenorhabditis remanei TaxID=31234 RepID=E3NBH4_CAERE|nr:hypothetical protein CRE_11441 [Caenorhabditis remanei]